MSPRPATPLAGMLWSKQTSALRPLDTWLEEQWLQFDAAALPGSECGTTTRMVSQVNPHHLVLTSGKYPWFASWDLGLSRHRLSTVDVD